ncbi:MAG: hypothetical protein LBP89_10085 [Helicobacteraceae bacterium]|nr:hypothetical protein [Helicobacteraceae bacterium]
MLGFGGLGLGSENAEKCELGAFTEGVSWKGKLEEYIDYESVVDWGFYIAGLFALLFVLKLAFGKTGALIGYAVIAVMIYAAL